MRHHQRLLLTCITLTLLLIVLPPTASAQERRPHEQGPATAAEVSRPLSEPTPTRNDDCRGAAAKAGCEADSAPTTSCPIEARSYTADGVIVNDGDEQSLRWAIEQANQSACDEVLVLPGVHLLTRFEPLEPTEDVHLYSNAQTRADRPVLSKPGPGRILWTGKVAVRVDDLVFDGGDIAPYGGSQVTIGFWQSCTEDTCSFTANRTTFREARSGGAILAGSKTSVVLHEVDVVDNMAELGAAGISIHGTALIERSTFARNRHTDPLAQGVAVTAVTDSDVTIRDSTFEDNTSQSGDVIFLTGGGTTTIIRSRLARNNKVGPLNWAVVTVLGGGTLQVQHSEIHENDAPAGAFRIWEGSTFRAHAITVNSGQHAHQVVGVAGNSDAHISNSTFLDLGVAPLPLSASFTKSNDGSTVALDFVTARTNRSVIQTNGGAADQWWVTNSYFETTGAPVCMGAPSAIDASPLNYFTDTSCVAPVIVGPALDFGPLTTGGGFGPSLMPTIGSPLIDAIPMAECTSPEDQRRRFRPNGDGCDIGAVEWYFSEGPIGIGGPG